MCAVIRHNYGACPIYSSLTIRQSKDVDVDAHWNSIAMSAMSNHQRLNHLEFQLNAMKWFLMNLDANISMNAPWKCNEHTIKLPLKSLPNRAESWLQLPQCCQLPKCTGSETILTEGLQTPEKFSLRGGDPWDWTGKDWWYHWKCAMFRVSDITEMVIFFHSPVAILYLCTVTMTVYCIYIHYIYRYVLCVYTYIYIYICTYIHN